MDHVVAGQVLHAHASEPAAQKWGLQRRFSVRSSSSPCPSECVALLELLRCVWAIAEDVLRGLVLPSPHPAGRRCWGARRAAEPHAEPSRSGPSALSFSVLMATAWVCSPAPGRQMTFVDLPRHGPPKLLHEPRGGQADLLEFGLPRRKAPVKHFCQDTRRPEARAGSEKGVRVGAPETLAPPGSVLVCITHCSLLLNVLQCHGTA